jgi:hypothetical protein
MFCSVAARGERGGLAVVMPAATMRVRIYPNECANLSHPQCSNE